MANALARELVKGQIGLVCYGSRLGMMGALAKRFTRKAAK